MAANFEKQAEDAHSEAQKLADLFDSKAKLAEKSQDILIVEFSKGERSFSQQSFPKKLAKVRSGVCNVNAAKVKVILETLPACLAQHQLDTAERLAHMVAELDPTIPWGAYYLSLVADLRGHMHLSQWYLTRAQSIKSDPVFTHQASRMKTQFVRGKEASL